jgi:hypothetical protein
MLEQKELLELGTLINQVTPQRLIEAELRALRETALPERGRKGSKGNQVRANIFTRARLEELRELKGKKAGRM